MSGCRPCTAAPTLHCTPERSMPESGTSPGAEMTAPSVRIRPALAAIDRAAADAHRLADQLDEDLRRLDAIAKHLRVLR